MAQIAKLGQLERLNLTKTDVSDQGLNALQGLDSLRLLNLSAMRFISDEGLKCVAGLTKLKSLDVSYSDLALKPISDLGMLQIRNLTQLERLQLHRTKITDAGLAGLSEMQHLKELGLPTGVSNQTLHRIKDLNVLESLVLPFADVDDQGVADLSNLKSLKSLNLAVSNKGNVTETGIGYLKNLRSLRSLFLQNSSVTDEGLSTLAKLPSLESLTLNGNHISFQGLDHLRQAAALRHVSLSGLTGDPDLQHLRSLTELRSISIGKHEGMEIGKDSDSRLEPLSGLLKLERLDLDDVALSDASLRHFKHMRQLRWLFARNRQNKITDEGLSHLSELTKLESLCISGAITDQGLSHLRNLRFLRVCRLGSRTLSDQALDQLRQDLPSIQDLTKYRPGGKKPPAVGAIAPDFNVATVSGDELHLSDLKGKVVLLYFWATWCSPCVKQTPELKQLYEKYREKKNFEMVSFSLDQTKNYARSHAERHQLSWPQVWIGTASTVGDDYGVDSAPHYVLVSPNGNILQTLSSSQSSVPRIELMESLDELLDQRK